MTTEDTNLQLRDLGEGLRRPQATDLVASPGSRSDWKARVAYEFSGTRAQLFREALIEYPKARRDDLPLMHEHLQPRPGDHVLGFGEGSGYFCRAIAEAVGGAGRYVITDPSPELLCSLPPSVSELPQVTVHVSPVERLEVPQGSFDKAWACGAFHHCADQTEAFKRVYRALKDGGRLVLLDVFQGTPLARHFDACVARYCETGHEVKFLSEEFARTLCHLAGFDERKVRIVDIPHRLCFATERDMGIFIYKVHAMTRFAEDLESRITRTIEGLKEHLTIDRADSQYVLHFDQKGLIADK